MEVAVLWVLLMISALVWELVCHRRRSRWTSLATLATRLWGHMPGRLLLVALWAFIGIHVFARYTLPV
jgi:hypothetical protein